MEEEIVVTVSPGEVTPPVVETPAPVVVVAETPPAATGTDPAAVLTLEILFAQVTEARQKIESLESDVRFLSDWQSSQSQRISELEVIEVDESELPPIVAEVIPAQAETPPESTDTPPRERKRKFI